ncbi:MAG: DUF3298 domain-containing protein [Kiritimatiellia bacterium]|jgi:hypothetical protein
MNNMHRTTMRIRPILMVSMALAAVAVGCNSGRQEEPEARYSDELSSYIEFCRSMALESDEKDVSPMWEQQSGGAFQEFTKTFKIIYGDADYLSFYATEASYTGGAHGLTEITVGTICRKTGKLLTLDDVFPVAERAALTRQLHQLVAEAIGEENILYDVQPRENFYRAADGWHFVYNPYEIAAYAQGVIDVVVKRETPGAAGK